MANLILYHRSDDTFSNSHLIDIRLSLWEPTDIKGIPYFDSNSGTMVWGAPSELPSEEFAAQFDHIVLFLDEMNSAAPSVQAAAYQLILNRQGRHVQATRQRNDCCGW